MKNIRCQLPEPNDEYPILSSYILGKCSILATIILALLTIPLAHYINQIPSKWTWYILILIFIYAYIPKELYARNLYLFFISSLTGFLLFIAVLFYSGILFLYKLLFEYYISLFYYCLTFFSLFYIFLMCLDIFFFRKLFTIYKKILIQSIIFNNNNQPEFVISNWYKIMKNNEYLLNINTPPSMKIGVITSIPLIIIGHFFVSPLLTTKILLKYGLNDALLLYLSILIIILGTIFIFQPVLEIIKIIVAFTLRSEDIIKYNLEEYGD